MTTFDEMSANSRELGCTRGLAYAERIARRLGHRELADQLLHTNIDDAAVVSIANTPTDVLAQREDTAEESEAAAMVRG